MRRAGKQRLLGFTLLRSIHSAAMGPARHIMSMAACWSAQEASAVAGSLRPRCKRSTLPVSEPFLFQRTRHGEDARGQWVVQRAQLGRRLATQVVGQRVRQVQGKSQVGVREWLVGGRGASKSSLVVKVRYRQACTATELAFYGAAVAVLFVKHPFYGQTVHQQEPKLCFPQAWQGASQL